MMGRQRVTASARCLLHNLVAHPIAGLLWALGLERAGDAVHCWWTDREG